MSGNEGRVVLETQDLTKVFGGLVALEGVHLTLRQGEILGLIGPNGAGKTTFINVVSGVYMPSRGKVIFQGKDVTLLPAHAKCRLGIARTFQLIHPLTDLNALQNIMVGAIFGSGLGLRQARREALAVADFLGLRDPERPVAELTALEVKKLEIARALVTRPVVLFLDEAMAGLNIDETEEVMGTVRRIREEGVTLCVVEHVMHVISKLTERVVVLDGGRVIAEGPYEEVAADERVIKAYLGEEEG